jgi:hypothetical protein
MTSRSNDNGEPGAAGRFISPKEIVGRWCCSRSSVDRIAARAGLSRVILGEGKNGTVRYVRAEVEAYEESRTIPGHRM